MTTTKTPIPASEPFVKQPSRHDNNGQLLPPIGWLDYNDRANNVRYRASRGPATQTAPIFGWVMLQLDRFQLWLTDSDSRLDKLEAENKKLHKAIAELSNLVAKKGA